jgi:hypothetical protein
MIAIQQPFPQTLLGEMCMVETNKFCGKDCWIVNI